MSLPALASGEPESASDTASNTAPDKYLFEQASRVYQVFSEVRKKPLPAPTLQKPVIVRGLASTGASRRADSVAFKVLTALQAGFVDPEPVGLPNPSSQGTQGISKP